MKKIILILVSIPLLMFFYFSYKNRGNAEKEKIIVSLLKRYNEADNTDNYAKAVDIFDDIIERYYNRRYITKSELMNLYQQHTVPLKSHLLDFDYENIDFHNVENEITIVDIPFEYQNLNSNDKRAYDEGLLRFVFNKDFKITGLHKISN